jgi:hypothetical protein
MAIRNLSDPYRSGHIDWRADETAGPFAGMELTDGEMIRLPEEHGGGLAVRFAAERIDGKSTHPVLKLGGKPALQAIVDERQRVEAAEAEARARQEAELKALPDAAFHGGVEAAPGESFRHRGQILTVVGYRRRRVWDDFEDEWRWKHVAGCRPATAEEAAALEAREAAKAARAELETIAKAIRQDGERPAGSAAPEGEEIRAGGGERIYGGGRWFVLGPGWIWYVQNNGHDGDDWSLSNVRTGGAGAIGWRVPAAAELAGRIRSLAATAYPGE